ncbi:transposase [Nonomuraea sp. B19D2]|uniref:transposase n=1 Tax=Nonomuraea sp. B19D2 TaxID=3159561 RepID=UPI0032DA65B9
MLRVSGQQIALWEALLPEEVTRLPQELAQIDAYLDDERFIAPWRSMFHARLGHPSVPVASLVRLLYLKHRYQLGYESLCRKVAESISWRHFCRIPDFADEEWIWRKVREAITYRHRFTDFAPDPQFRQHPEPIRPRSVDEK